MDFIQLPTPPKPFYSQRVTLDGADFTLTFEWNMRSGWYLSMADANDEVIFSGTKLVVNWNLLRTVTDERKPPGMLKLIDTATDDITGEAADPGYYDLDQRCKLIYLSADELAELIAGA